MSQDVSKVVFRREPAKVRCERYFFSRETQKVRLSYRSATQRANKKAVSIFGDCL